MEPKKNPEVDLEKKKGVFFQVGLITVLAVVLLAFEWTVYEQQAGSLGDLVVELEEEEMIPITQQEVTPPPPPPPQAVQIEIVEDDEEIEEIEIEETEIDEDTEVEIVEVEEEVVEEPTIFTIVEENPEFVGGEAELFKFLGKNIKYPPMAKDAGIKGVVYVNFVVYETGEIKDVKVLRGIGGGCDEEAIRVVKSMPKWKPGKQRGKAVRVSYNLPIRFSLR